MMGTTGLTSAAPVFASWQVTEMSPTPSCTTRSAAIYPAKGSQCGKLPHRSFTGRTDNFSRHLTFGIASA